MRPLCFCSGTQQSKQTEEQMTQIHRSSYLPYLSTFSFSSQQPPHTSRCLSLCYLGVWPSCSCGSTLKVTLCTHRHCLSLPHQHRQPHTHIHAHAPSVPGPVNDILSVESPTCLQFAFAKRTLWQIELERSNRFQVNRARDRVGGLLFSVLRV